MSCPWNPLFRSFGADPTADPLLANCHMLATFHARSKVSSVRAAALAVLRALPPLLWDWRRAKSGQRVQGRLGFHAQREHLLNAA